MTEKRLFVGRKTVEDRFTIIGDYDGEIGVKENRSGDVLVLKHSDLNAQQFVAQLVVFLNDQNQAIVDLYDGSKYWSDKATEMIKELQDENERLKRINKGQELEIVRLHKLADAMSGVLRELGVYDVYDKQQIENRKKENEQLKSDNNRLVNETAKVVAEHQKRVLDLIDEKIAEYNMYYETQIEDQSYYEANAMKECVIALQELKKEL